MLPGRGPLEPTQQELVLKAFQEEGFSNTDDVGEFFGAGPVCDAHGRSAALYCKEFTRQRSIEKVQDSEKRPSNDRNWFLTGHLRFRHHCMVLQGHEESVSYTMGTSEFAPAVGSRSVHRETASGSSSHHTTTTRPIAPRPARFRQAWHWETDCFPVTISAR